MVKSHYVVRIYFQNMLCEYKRSCNWYPYLSLASSFISTKYNGYRDFNCAISTSNPAVHDAERKWQLLFEILRNNTKISKFHCVPRMAYFKKKLIDNLDTIFNDIITYRMYLKMY